MSQAAVPARQRTRQDQDRPQPTHAAPASAGRQGAKPEAPDHSQLEDTVAGQAHALQLLQLTETLEAAAEPAEPLSQAPSAAATRPAACTAQPGPGRVDPPICSDFSGKVRAETSVLLLFEYLQSLPPEQHLLEAPVLIPAVLDMQTLQTVSDAYVEHANPMNAEQSPGH